MLKGAGIIRIWYGIIGNNWCGRYVIRGYLTYNRICT